MTDAPGTLSTLQLRSELRDWCEAWKSCFQDVLSQASGRPHLFDLAPQPPPAADSDLWYTVVAGGAVHGEMALRLPTVSGAWLAEKFLGSGSASEGSPPGAANISADDKEALEEFLRQTVGLVATAVAASAGGEVQLHLSSSAAPSWSSDTVICLQGRDEAGVSVAFEIRISPALAAELQSRAQTRAQTQTQTTSSTPESATGVTPSASLPAASSYRRLMDVGLEVKLRFGTRRMSLRDVLALSAGAVVELDNSLQSPVDLLLDGRLIAQGEVVIIDGKYGLRVTEVADSPPPAGELV
jgi:flagellar motor switch protein FliN